MAHHGQSGEFTLLTPFVLLSSQNTLFNQHVYHVISPRSLFTKWSDSPHGYIFLFSLSLPRMAGWILKTQKKILELTSLPHESFQILPGFRSHFGVPLQFGHGQVGVHRQRVPQSPSYRSQFFLDQWWWIHLPTGSCSWTMKQPRISSRISSENETRLEAIWKWNNHGIFMNSVLDLLMLQFKILRAVFFLKKRGQAPWGDERKWNSQAFKHETYSPNRNWL